MIWLVLLLLLVASPAHAGFCDRVEACFDRPTPTPRATSTPAPTATPKPTFAPRCDDGTIAGQESPTTLVRANYKVRLGAPNYLCANVPESAAMRPLLQFQTTNKANAQCSTLTMTWTSPTGLRFSDKSWQPQAVAWPEPGRWQVELFQDSAPDCSTYDLRVRW